MIDSLIQVRVDSEDHSVGKFLIAAVCTRLFDVNNLYM